MDSARFAVPGHMPKRCDPLGPRLDGFRCMQSGIYRGLSGHVPSDSQEVFRKHQTCAQHQVFIYELSAETSRPGTLKFPTIEPFLLLLSPFSPRRPIPPGSSFFAACFASLSQLVSRLVSRPFSRIFSHCERTPQSHAILEIMSDAIENTTGSADSNDKTKLIGRESDVVPGRFGEPLQITHVQYSRGGGNTAPKRPLFLCLHGWGLRRAIQRFRLVARAADVAAGWPLCTRRVLVAA